MAFQFNAFTQQLYSHISGVSPSDLGCVTVRKNLDYYLDYDELPYHGDYTLNWPITIIKNGEYVLTASGNLFTCSREGENMTFVRDIGCTYIDCAYDYEKDVLYLLTKDNEIVILEDENFRETGRLNTEKRTSHVLIAGEQILLLDDSGKLRFQKPALSLHLQYHRSP